MALRALTVYGTAPLSVSTYGRICVTRSSLSFVGCASQPAGVVSSLSLPLSTSGIGPPALNVWKCRCWPSRNSSVCWSTVSVILAVRLLGLFLKLSENKWLTALTFY